MSTPQQAQAVSKPVPTSWGHNFVDISKIEWEPGGLPGAEKKVLYSDPVAGRSTVLWRMAPGAVIPFHEHTDVELTYVLEGSLVDHIGECTAGNFCWRDAGSRHNPHCPDGCIMLVTFLKPPKLITAADE